MLYKFLLLCLLFCPAFSMAQYQVCSITINSSDEIETFQKFLPAKDFKFIELLPSQKNELQDHSTHWFDDACKKSPRCDILVVSGHFGGTFFGKSSYALPTELLEEKSCQNSCPNILSHVKEIFLFGCNTLASKTKDKRSYTEYLKVLLDDGLARETAERVVAARYSPLETDFRSRMNFVFSGSHTIYGFDELSPLGPHVRKPLRKYFQFINKNFGSYANYLKTGQYKRASNKELFRYFPRNVFTLNQAHISLAEEEPQQKKFFYDKCLLYDRTKNFPQRLQALEDIFKADQSGSAFFAIDYFLNHNKTEVVEGKGRKIFRSIRTNENFAKNFRSYYPHLEFLPYIRLVYLNVLEKFRWMGPFDLKILRKENLLKLIKKPDPESYISLLLLLKENQIQPESFYISKQELPANYIQNIWGLLIFEKLRAFAPNWQRDILKYCRENIKTHIEICYQSLNTLAHIHPSVETAQEALSFLDSQDSGLIYYSIRMLGQSGIKDYLVHKRISDFLKSSDPHIQQEAREALGFLQTPYQYVQNEVAKPLSYANSALVKDIFWSLSRMNLQPPVQDKIIQYMIQNKDEPKVMRQAFSTFQNTSEFSDIALSFIYNQLESDDLEFALYIVEVLSHNKVLKDFGIHHRFVKFQEESSELKQMLLQKMSSLTWLHPELQVSWLDYMRDENPEVRILAINILRNIKNLQAETIHYIKKMYQEEKIPELKEFLSSL